MIRKFSPLLLCLLLHPPIVEAQVLMEVPLLLELPGKENLIRAWHDGEEFFVDGKELLETLGFSLRLVESRLEAVDVHHRHEFSCVDVPRNQSCRIPIPEVLDRFGSAVHFDEERLHLQASSAAATFDVDALREWHWTEVPGPPLFGRTRKLWGGMMANWKLRRDVLGMHPSLRVTGSALLGTVEAELGRRSSWIYRHDFPGKPWLTQMEAGYNADRPAGLSITNLPLARQRLQRVRMIRGQSTPHALVQAVIGSEVVDQVQADAEGNYQLHAPVWYGTTRLEVRIRSMGGAQMVSEFQDLFISSSLVPPGKVYYHMRVDKREQALRMQYGVQNRLTLRSVLLRANRYMAMTAGFTLSPVLFLSLDAEMKFPSASWLANLQLWRSQVQVMARIHGRHREFLHANMTASAGKGTFSILLRGNYSATTGQVRQHSLSPEVWLHHPDGLFMQVRWGLDGVRGSSMNHRVHHRWRLAAGGSFARIRLLAFADQKPVERVYGLEGIFTVRHQSLAFRIGWDAGQQSVIGSLRVQLSSALGSLFARGQRDAYGMSHSQEIQGSIHLGRGIHLAPSGHQESAVELRIFEDGNGNGIQDVAEKILPHIEAQLHQGGWHRLRTGALYASHLEPWQHYQIRILEESIRNPSLHPATGLEFSFIADPGQRKVIHIPMQRRIPIQGQIIHLDRAPLRLRVLLNQGKSADVYRDGTFVFHVRPGEYTLTVMDILTEEVLAEKTVKVNMDPHQVTIDLEKE